MKKLDAAYLAGLIDGEGHLQITKEKNPPRQDRPTYKYAVAIGMTKAKVLLNEIKAIHGGNIYSYEDSRESRAQVWTWQLTSKATLEPFLKGILPYLRLKDSQAKLLLEFLDTVQPNRPNGRKGLPQSVRDKRERLWKRMKKLNAVGVR